MTEPGFRRSPAEARRVAVIAATCLPGVLIGVAIAALHGNAPPYFDLGGALILLPVFGVIIYRSATIAIDADEDRVVIRNPYRTRVLRWADVESVERRTQAPRSVPVFP